MEVLNVDNGRSNWGVAETKKLIAIWGHADIQSELDKMYRNSEIYEEVSKKMRKMGFKRNKLQCRNKIKQLKNEYKKIKDSNSKSGPASKYFEDLDSILGDRTATGPPPVLATTTTVTDISKVSPTKDEIMEEEAETENRQSERRYGNAADESSYESVLQIFKDDTFQTSVLKPVVLKMLSEPIRQAVAKEVERFISTLVRPNGTIENKRPMIDSLLEANARLVDAVKQYQSAIETSVPTEKWFSSCFSTTENVCGQKTNNLGPRTKRHASWSDSTSDDDSREAKVRKTNRSAAMSPGRSTRPKGTESNRDLESSDDRFLETNSMKTNTDFVTSGNRSESPNVIETQTDAVTSDHENKNSYVTETHKDEVTSGNGNESVPVTEIHIDVVTSGNDISSNATGAQTDAVSSDNQNKSSNATEIYTAVKELGNESESPNVTERQTDVVTSGNENKSPADPKTHAEAENEKTNQIQNVKETSADAVQPGNEKINPSQNVKKTNADAVKPGNEKTNPSQNVKKTNADAVQPGNEKINPCQNVKKTNADAVKPGNEKTNPSQNVKKTNADAVKVSNEMLNSSQNVKKTSADTVKPGNEKTNSSQNVKKTSADAVEPGNEKTNPSQNVTKTKADVVTSSKDQTRPSQTIKKTNVDSVTSGNKKTSPYAKKTNQAAMNINGELQDNTMPKSLVVAENMHCKMTESAWRNLADQEIDDGRREGVGSKQGTHAVLCIDTSDSMNEGNAWSQVQKFYEDYLDGVEQIKDQNAHYDNIAVVTFGHETKVQQRLTKNLKNLRGLLDNIKPRGPSPIFGGLVMAVAAAQTSNFSFANVNNLHVIPKIILVTDGKPTELTLREGPDVPNPRKLEQTKGDIFAEVESLRRAQIDLHCIYVGQNADREFLQSLQSENIMELMSYRDGEKMALSTVLKCMREGDQRFVLSAGSELPTSLFDTQTTPDVDQLATTVKMLSKQLLPEQDAQCMADLLKSLSTKGKTASARPVPGFKLSERTRYKTATLTMAGNRLINVYKEINDGNHPAIGTRVERDDDWTWGNQDNNNNGTIIGHATDPGDGGQCWVHVEWDDDKTPEKGKQNVYRYKMNEDMEGDVRETAEDRKPPAGKVLAVGCRVIPGDGFCGDTTDKKGTVIRFHGNRGEVKWDDGSKGRYRYGNRAAEIVPMMDPDRTAFVPARTTPEVPTSSEEGALKINISDKHIQQIAQTISPGWQILGTELGVGNVQMNHIARDYRESIVMQIVNMLIVWKNSTENHTLDVLVDAIRRSGVLYDNDRLEAILQEIRGTTKK